MQCLATLCTYVTHAVAKLVPIGPQTRRGSSPASWRMRLGRGEARGHGRHGGWQGIATLHIDVVHAVAKSSEPPLQTRRGCSPASWGMRPPAWWRAWARA